MNSSGSSRRETPRSRRDHRVSSSALEDLRLNSDDAKPRLASLQPLTGEWDEHWSSSAWTRRARSGRVTRWKWVDGSRSRTLCRTGQMRRPTRDEARRGPGCATC